MTMLVSLIAAAAGETYCPGLGDMDVKWGNPTSEGNGWRVNGEGGVMGRTSFNLLGGYIEFDIDACEGHPGHDGMNNNLYTISPDGGMGSGYCDVQVNDSPQCMELDLAENNGNSNGRTTWHTWENHDGGCDMDGCYADFSLSGSCKYHMRSEFADDGGINVYRNGDSLSVTQSGSLESPEKNYIVQMMNSRGAAIVSTQWFGWTPDAAGASAGMAASMGRNESVSVGDDKGGSFAVTNVVVHAPRGIKFGPSPPTCNPPTPGPPTPTPPPGQCRMFVGMNNDGTNLGSGGSASSADDCCNQCAAASGCVGFTWVHATNECWLKSVVGSPRDDDCGGCVTSGTVSGPAPTPVPAPTPTPTPATPTPSPSPSGDCPGGSLSACVKSCPTSPATVFEVCVRECTIRCGVVQSCTGGDDGVDLASCVGSCPSDGYSDCVGCCAGKFPSMI